MAPFTFDDIKGLGLSCEVTQGQTGEATCRGKETVPSSGFDSARLSFQCPDVNCPLTWLIDADLGGISDPSIKLLECTSDGDGYWHHEAEMKAFPACCKYTYAKVSPSPFITMSLF